jgi:nitroreductase
LDIFEVIKGRRSIRRFQDESVPDEHLRLILQAACQAPSGNNRQPWHFVVVKNKKVLQEMAAAVHSKMDQILTWPEAREYEREIRRYRYFFTFFSQAPVVIAVLREVYTSSISGLVERRGLTLYHHSAEQSASAAAENLILAAKALGYGSCWMTGPLVAIEELERMLQTKPGRHLMALIPLGKPAQEPPPRPRKSLEEVVTWIE